VWVSFSYTYIVKDLKEKVLWVEINFKDEEFGSLAI
jgi:hypothetical protein